MDFNMIIAGFGGQGILFTGKVFANLGLDLGKKVSWLPSYGPEMRGGTANCSVCISDEEIACPIVDNPQFLVAMNKPSFEKFANKVLSGGNIFIDSSLVEISDFSLEDINIYKIPATQLAVKNGIDRLGNMIMLGYIIKKLKFTDFENIKNTVGNCISANKKYLIDANIKALTIGYEYN